MISRKEIKLNAKKQLSGNWILAILTLMCYKIFISYSNIGINRDYRGLINLLILIFIGAIQLGASRFILNLIRENDKAKFTDLFSGFDVFVKALILTVMISIIISLGTILFVVPGVIFMIMFSQSYFILADNKELSSIDCLIRSAKIMKNHKMEFFILILSFIGWYIGCIFTLGIGMIWLIPYYEVTLGNYYEQLDK